MCLKSLYGISCRPKEYMALGFLLDEVILKSLFLPLQTLTCCPHNLAMTFQIKLSVSQSLISPEFSVLSQCWEDSHILCTTADRFFGFQPKCCFLTGSCCILESFQPLSCQLSWEFWGCFQESFLL